MSDFSEGHYKYKAKNKCMKAAAQQAQQPLKAVVKAAVQEANARTTCYKHAAANIVEERSILLRLIRPSMR